MEIQKEILEQELSTWMKAYEQTDDILVMGVRVAFFVYTFLSFHLPCLNTIIPATAIIVSEMRME